MVFFLQSERDLNLGGLLLSLTDIVIAVAVTKILFIFYRRNTGKPQKVAVKGGIVLIAHLCSYLGNGFFWAGANEDLRLFDPLLCNVFVQGHADKLGENRAKGGTGYAKLLGKSGRGNGLPKMCIYVSNTLQ